MVNVVMFDYLHSCPFFTFICKACHMVPSNVFHTCYNGDHTPPTTTTTDYVIQPSQLIGMADSLDRNSFAKETNKHKTHSNSNSNTTHGIESDEGYQSPDLLLHMESEYYDVY